MGSPRFRAALFEAELRRLLDMEPGTQVCPLVKELVVHRLEALDGWRLSVECGGLPGTRSTAMIFSFEKQDITPSSKRRDRPLHRSTIRR